MITVSSTNIRSIDYDKVKHELTVIFLARPRERYVYYNVLPKIWVKFVQAESKGQFFADRIKNEYPYRIIKQR